LYEEEKEEEGEERVGVDIPTTSPGSVHTTPTINK